MNSRSTSCSPRAARSSPAMGSTKNSASAECVESVRSRVRAELAAHVQPGASVLAALSGGVDSVALVDLLHGCAGPLGFSLAALHVNHGLSPNASFWAQFCAELCEK